MKSMMMTENGLHALEKLVEPCKLSDMLCDVRAEFPARDLTLGCN